MRFVFSAIAGVLLISTPAVAQIYQCTDERGQTVFSQRPCGGDAKKVEVEVTGSGLSLGGNDGFEKVLSSNEKRELERRLRSVEAEADSLTDQRNRELAALRQKKALSANNLAGATWEESISTEMQMVADNYNDQIEQLRHQADRIRSRISEIE